MRVDVTTRMPPVLALSAALAISAGWLGSPRPARAAADSDIPGVPLPGSVVTGQLGGPIYDVVYQVDVPAGRVLLISLTGEAGTDFDLYLFDQTATSVYSSTPVASSTSDTSTESISYPTVTGGRYYIDLSGFSVTQGAFRLTVQTAADMTRPRVSLALDGGAPATTATTVTATVVATDDLSGVDAMQFSEDGVTWQPWQAYAPTVLWSFPEGDGTKRLWVRVRDRQGNVSTPAAGSIALDTVAPTVVVRAPGPGELAFGLRPTLRVEFSEAIRPQSWSDRGLILQDPDGTVLFGSYEWDPLTNVGSFTPSQPLQAGAVHTVSLGAVADLAGNALAPGGGWTIRPVVVPTISLAASHRLAAQGQDVVVSGVIDQRPAGTLVLERSIGDGSWAPIDVVSPDAAGVFSSTQSVMANTRFRVQYSGSDTAAPAWSQEARVLVRRQVSLAGVSPTTTRTSVANQTISLRAVVTPADPDVAVVLRIFRYDAARRTYRLTATIQGASADGTAAFTWRPRIPGNYYARLTTPPTSLYANGISSAYRWRITAP